MKAREHDLDIRERKLAAETSEMEHQRLRDQRKFNKVGTEVAKSLDSSKIMAAEKDPFWKYAIVFLLCFIVSLLIQKGLKFF